MDLSVSSNGSNWVKPNYSNADYILSPLSVSSNGSNWVKPGARRAGFNADVTFSILERIELGETSSSCGGSLRRKTFSILERIELGETVGCGYEPLCVGLPFSILERIELGETTRGNILLAADTDLSVSSNGSNWVKLGLAAGLWAVVALLSVSSNGSNWVKRCIARFMRQFPKILSVSSNGSNWVKHGITPHLEASAPTFQYPRTDRIG